MNNFDYLNGLVKANKTDTINLSEEMKTPRSKLIY